MEQETRNKIEKTLSKIGIGSLALSIPNIIAMSNLPEPTLVNYMIALTNIMSVAYLSTQENDNEQLQKLKDIKSLYQELIKEYNKLNNTFELKHPIEIYTLLYHMLQDGNLSHGRKLQFDNPTKLYEKPSIFGCHVINGKAVCRHIATLLKDIYRSYGINADTLIVSNKDYSVDNYEKMIEFINTIDAHFQLEDLSLEDLQYKHEDEINKFYHYYTKKDDNVIQSIIGNHMITSAIYNGQTYYLDPSQGRIYKPSQKNPNLLLDSKMLRDIKIIPLSNIGKLSKLPKSYPTFAEYFKYMINTQNIYFQNQDIIDKFYNEQRELYYYISTLLIEISREKGEKKTHERKLKR